MGTDDVAALIQIIAGRVDLAGIALQKCQIVTVGDEAYVLAVTLFGVQKALLLRNRPGFCLGQLAQRETGMPQLMLGKGVEEIGLILGLIHRFAQQIPICGLPDPGIVTGDDAIAAQRQGALQKFAEFQVPVALHAGVGGQPGLIAACKMIHYPAAEFPGEIQHVEGNPQPRRHSAGIRHGGGVAAAGILPGVQLHGGAFAGVALLQH